LTRLIDDPGARGGPDPRQRIVNKFGIHRLVERTEAALASLVQS
jgi:hypothetical protein